MKQNNEQLKNFFVKELENEEFTGSFDYEIHAEPFLGEYGNGEPCTFKPHVADVRFGRTNEERRANAEHIVKCCNGYEALIKQNEDLLYALQLMKAEYQEYQMQTGNAWGLQNTKAETEAIKVIEAQNG